MIPKLIIIFLLIISSTIFSQQINNFKVLRDTSYTLKSAYNKYKKDYPFIRPVYYDSANGNMRYNNVIYKSSGNRPLVLDIFSGLKDSEHPGPVVIMVHGGGWSSGDRSLMYPLADYLAKHGCTAVTIEYRLSPEAKYPAAADDVKDAVAWAFKHGKEYQIDTTRIVILGCSAGAQLAGLAGLTYGTDQNNPSVKKIHAIINIDGIMDFTSEEARKYEDDPGKETTAAGKWFGGRYSEKTKLWHEASPVNYVTEDSAPILFINSSIPRFHAGRDDVIKKLGAFSIYYEIQTFEDAPHSFWLFYPWLEKTGMYIIRFLKKV